MGGSLFLILWLLTAGFVVLALVRRATARWEASHGSTCGRCDYSARGLTTFVCPECGGDLREVGILPSEMRGGFGTPSHLSRKLMTWTVVLAVFGFIFTSMVGEYCLPAVTSASEDYRLAGPPSSQYRHVNFHSYSYQLHWPFGQPARSHIADKLDIVLAANNGKTLGHRCHLLSSGSRRRRFGNRRYSLSDTSRPHATPMLPKVSCDGARACDQIVRNLA